MANKQIVKIPLSNVEKLEIYVTRCKKTLLQVKSETGANYVLNGGMWNGSDITACPHLKSNGFKVSKDPNPYWDAYGYGWNEADIKLESSAAGLKNSNNFISCTLLIKDSAEIQKMSYDKAQGGKRGRTAMGLSKNNLVLYCSQDGSSDAKTPELLGEEMLENGCESAIMLDSGGSSMCDFEGQRIYGDKRKVHNWILVYLKNEKKEDEKPMVDTGDKIIEKYITKNPCYTSQQKKAKKSMMLHSTATPGAKASAFINTWNSASSTVAVEFVIDDTGIYQLLPLGIKSWHGGGTSNNTHIGCEVCEPVQARLIDINWKPLYRNGPNNTTWAVTQLQKELQAWGYDPNGIDGSFGPGCESALKAFQAANGLDADGSCGPSTKKKLATRNGSYLKYNPDDAETKAYFDNVYQKAVWLFAEVLKKVGGKSSDIVSHAEGYKLGIATNHADVGHWFPLHGKTMDVFRADVEKAMNGGEVEVPEVNVETADSWAKTAWEKAATKIGKDGKTIMDGTRPKDNITRQEVAVVLDRLGLLD